MAISTYDQEGKESQLTQTPAEGPRKGQTTATPVTFDKKWTLSLGEPSLLTD